MSSLQMSNLPPVLIESHDRSPRFASLAAGLLLCLLTVLGGLMWRADRQEKLDRTLIATITHNDVKAASAALQQGADANSECYYPEESENRTFIINLAIIHKNSSLVALLLTHGARVNSKDFMGWTPFIWAKKDSAILRLLQQAGAKE